MEVKYKPKLDYSNTIIYKIVCKDKTITDLYVGHTTDFVRRKQAHMYSCISQKESNRACKLYEIINLNGGWSNWKMDIIACFDCADLYAARTKEQEYYISLNATLNSIEPLPPQKIKTKLNNKDKPQIYKPISIDPLSSPKNIKINKTYECEICNYITANKKDFNKHNLTRKHLTLTLKLTDKSIDQSIVYTCNCGKPYKHRQSLFSHKKTCTKMNSESFPSEASCNQRNGLPTGATDSTDLNENSHSTTYRSVNADEISNLMVGTNQFSNELLYNLLKEIAVSNAKNDELKNMVIKQTTTNDELKNMFIKQNEQLIQQNAQLMKLLNLQYS